ncbi:MAG TPA: MoaD/ThiS family protein [Anaerolineales bacterium]|nr:MoaD/ThiS family protein [Anaerolineales bacterium]
MPVVGIPSLLRDLTNGQQSLIVEGDTIRDVIDNLDKLYPGLKERLYDGDRLRPSIAVVVDGRTSTLKLREKLQASSEVHFVISISGGRF